MTKRETYGTKTRKEVRKNYREKLDEVYEQEGFIAGLKYEISSGYHSLMTALANLSDDAKHPSTDSKGRYHNFGTIERYERDKATDRIRDRTQQNREHLLRGPKKGLEKTAATLAIIGIVGGAFLVSSNITGNAIADLSTETTSLVGVGLFILAILAGFFLLKRKNKVSKKRRRH